MFLKHLAIKYDEKKLISECTSLKFEPFRITQRELNQDHSNFNEDYNPDSWFNKTNTWLIHRVRKFSESPEIYRLYEQFTSKLGLIETSIFKQLPNSEVPFHSDYAKVRCAINFVLSENAEPIVFKDHKSINYKCALIDITKKHRVPASKTERLLLKFNIFDKEYEDAKQIL